MKRDLDLCRQLLADIEGHGPDCAVTSLRPGVSGEAEETVRYHVRLLIDAGLAKEVDRNTGGVPCVRLTNAGHEMLELAHSEARWREAKWVVAERTGTQSLTVIRSVLVRWACEAATVGERWRPRRAAGYGHRPYAYAEGYRASHLPAEPRYRFERDLDAPVEPRPTASAYRRPYAYLERFDWRDGLERDAFYRDAYYREPLHREPLHRDGVYRAAPYAEREWLDLDGVSLPTHVV